MPERAVTWYQKFAASRLSGVVKLLLILIPLGFLVRSLLVNWQALEEMNIALNPARLGLAMLILVLVFGLLPLAAQIVLIYLGYRLNYPATYAAYFIAQLAKYLPGGIWIVPGRIVAFNLHGVPPLASTMSVVLELALLVLTGTLACLLFLSSRLSARLSLLLGAGLFLIVIILFILVSRRAVFNRLLGKWAKDVQFNLTPTGLIKVLVVDLTFWVLVGCGFFVLLSAVQPISLSLWPALTGAFSAAWVLGFLAFLSPGGLGVREGALAVFLAFFFPAPLPALIALLARLWWTSADALSFAAAYGLRRLMNTGREPGQTLK